MLGLQTRKLKREGGGGLRYLHFLFTVFINFIYILPETIKSDKKTIVGRIDEVFIAGNCISVSLKEKRQE